MQRKKCFFNFRMRKDSNIEFDSTHLNIGKRCLKYAKLFSKFTYLIRIFKSNIGFRRASVPFAFLCELRSHIKRNFDGMKFLSQTLIF